MKNLRIYFGEKKFLAYFLILPLILIILFNLCLKFEFNNEMKKVRVGLLLDEGMQKDKNILQSFISIAQNAAYKNDSFVKYEKLETKEEAEKALNENKIDMYVSVKDRDLTTLNKNLNAYAVGDKKTLTEEELGDGLVINAKMARVDENNLLIKEYLESIVKSANMQRELVKTVSQEDMIKSLEKNRYKRLVMPGMPYQFLNDSAFKTPSMKLGDYIEDKYIKGIEKFLEENTRDVQKIQSMMKEYQKYKYKGAKEESLKQNIPTDEQIELREQEAHKMDHNSMMVATESEPLDLKKAAENQNNENVNQENQNSDEEMLKKQKEEEEKNEQRKAAQDKIQKEKADEQEKIAREVFFKLDNGKRIYILTGIFAFLIFMQGVLNIRYFEKRNKIMPLEKATLRNLKKGKVARMHLRDFLTAFFVNLLFTFLFYFIILSILKISAGIEYVSDGKFEITKMVEYFKINVPKFFENYTVNISLILSTLYALVITKISYIFYLCTYKKEEKVKNIIYSLIGILLLIFGLYPGLTNVISNYLTRLNPMYLYINGLYMLRYNGNNSFTYANIVMLVGISIILSIISIISLNARINKLRKEENEFAKMKIEEN